MHRAIPEVNKICTMAERTRQYKLHLEALAKIKTKKAEVVNQPSSELPKRVSLRERSFKVESEKIAYENNKMFKAMIYQAPTLSRADFIAHEIEHKHQVNRMVTVAPYLNQEKRKSALVKCKSRPPETVTLSGERLFD